MQADELRVQAADHIPHIHALGLHGNVAIVDERVQRGEILGIAPGEAEHLGPAQDGGDIVALRAERLVIAGEREGILVLGEIVVAHHRQDGGGRELVVEVHEGLDGFLVAAELPQDVVARPGGLLAGAGGLLDVVEGAERLLV